jgi:hypothetical protein
LVAPWLPPAAEWLAIGTGVSAQFLRNVAEVIPAIFTLDKNTRPSAGLIIIQRGVMEGPMEALLTAITLWLSTNFILPATFDHPRIEFVSSKEMTALFYAGIGRQEQAGMVSDPSDVVSLYSNESKTIYLLHGWNGKTPAELSILVHEMVHHLQNAGQLNFACPQEREEVAYNAQDRWLGQFGTDLMREFQMDPFTILMKSKCL